MHIQTAIIRIALGCVSLSLPLLVYAQAATLQGEYVIRKAIPPNFEVHDRFIRYGRETADGMCQFDKTLSVGPNERIEEIEIAYDPMTCRSVVVRGVTKRKTRTDKQQNQTDSRFQEKESATAAADETFCASFRTWIIDPIYITLNEVDSKIAWRPKDGCATGDYVSHDPAYDWLRFTGWRKLKSDAETSADCSAVSLNASATYRNSSFPTCRSPAYAIYDENVVVGDASGGATGNSMVRRAGPRFLCTGLWTEQTDLSSETCATERYTAQMGCFGQPPILFFYVDLPPQSGNVSQNINFSTTLAGNDYNGQPLYFGISGQLRNTSLVVDIATYTDPGYTEHVRTDKCQGELIDGHFYAENCTLVRDTTAGCVPIWLQLDKGELAQPNPFGVPDANTEYRTFRRVD